MLSKLVILLGCVLRTSASESNFTYKVTVTLSDELNAQVWVKFQSWVLNSYDDYESATTPWNYIGPLKAGSNSFSVTTNNEGEYQSRVYFGFYGTGSSISTTMTDLQLKNSTQTYYSWSSGDSVWSCTADTTGCCVIVRDTYVEDLYSSSAANRNYQSNGVCNDLLSFESYRDGVIPTSEPTLAPSNRPTLVPTSMPTAVPAPVTSDESEDSDMTETDDANEVTVVITDVVTDGKDGSASTEDTDDNTETDDTQDLTDTSTGNTNNSTDTTADDENAGPGVGPRGEKRPRVLVSVLWVVFCALFLFAALFACTYLRIRKKAPAKPNIPKLNGKDCVAVKSVSMVSVASKSVMTPSGLPMSSTARVASASDALPQMSSLNSAISAVSVSAAPSVASGSNASNALKVLNARDASAMLAEDPIAPTGLPRNVSNYEDSSGSSEDAGNEGLEGIIEDEGESVQISIIASSPRTVSVRPHVANISVNSLNINSVSVRSINCINCNSISSMDQNAATAGKGEFMEVMDESPRPEMESPTTLMSEDAGLDGKDVNATNDLLMGDALVTVGKETDGSCEAHDKTPMGTNDDYDHMMSDGEGEE